MDDFPYVTVRRLTAKACAGKIPAFRIGTSIAVALTVFSRHLWRFSLRFFRVIKDTDFFNETVLMSVTLPSKARLSVPWL